MLNDESPSTSNGVDSGKQTVSSYPLAKLLENVEKAYDKGKKLLDESKKSAENGGILYNEGENERDEEYKKAVESGDTQKAKRW